MRFFKHCFVATFVVLFLAVAARAQEPIRFARTPDISPDGKFVAFSYLGDVWVVESVGGTARQLTRHIAHDVGPVFSPDGRTIAFSSNRHGNYDVYLIPMQGGKAKQLTFDSAADIVTGWSPDGKHVLFASTRDTAFPPGFGLYSVPADGGRVKRVSAGEGARRRLLPRRRSDRLRPRAGHVVSQGLSRLVQRRHLDLQRRRRQQPPAHRLYRPGQLAHVERRRKIYLLR